MTTPRRAIALIGLSGAGKSTVAGLVAAQFGWDALDSDVQIERTAGRSIPEIFSNEGEPAFRAREVAALQELANRDGVVIATGGGAPTTRPGTAVLADVFVAWLRVTPETAAARLAANPATEARPLLAGGAAQRLRNLAAERATAYEAAADAIVDVDGLLPAEVASRVAAAYLAQPGATLEPAARVRTAGADYGIFVSDGLLDRLGQICNDIKLKGRAFVITDKAVERHFGERAMQALAAGGYRVETFAMDPGEAHKNLATASALWDWLLGHRVERNDFVVCLGGGVVTDVGGFVASATLRGIPFVHVPTTLLGMADASIGGKTGLDHPMGKNLIGAFVQPAAVVCDPSTLATLPERELRSGWAEIVKHGFILDEGLVSILEQHAGDPRAMQSAALIARGGARIKAAVVSADERESDVRSLLNYGHTVGHAIEAVQAYTGLLHGEAVAVGMHAAGIIGRELGMFPASDFDRQQALIAACGLPDHVSGVSVDSVLDATRGDKKSRDGRIRWVLLERLGKATTRNDVPDSLVRSAVKAVTTGYAL